MGTNPVLCTWTAINFDTVDSCWHPYTLYLRLRSKYYAFMCSSCYLKQFTILFAYISLYLSNKNRQVYTETSELPSLFTSMRVSPCEWIARQDYNAMNEKNEINNNHNERCTLTATLLLFYVYACFECCMRNVAIPTMFISPSFIYPFFSYSYTNHM